MRQEPGREIGGLVEARERPDVRDPVERPEQGDDLGEAAVEGPRLVRPRDPRNAIPERLAVDGIVEHHGITELPDLSADEAVRVRLVPRQETRLGGIDRGRSTWG